MSFRFLCMIVVSLAGALPLAAQQPEPRQPMVQVFEEAVDVRVVNVEAVVTDEKGARVRGLSAKDLRLLVDGHEVPVEYFAEVEDGKAAAVPAAAAPAGGAQAPASPGEAVQRSYLIYIDDSFSIAGIRNEALAKLERDLKLLRPGDQMAVLAFDGSRIDVLSRWTGDAAALAAALERARRRPATGGQQLSHQRALQSDVKVVHENDIGDGDTNPLTNNLDREMEALEPRVSPEARTQLGRTAAAVAGALRGFEVPAGRKVLLLLSGAWTMSVAPQLYQPMIEAANRLGYTIYPMDLAQSSSSQITALGALAERTGGRMVVSAKMDVLSEVAADTGFYYWLGFTPAWKADDRGHQVTVEARRRGLRIRARSGFSDLSKKTENAMRAESVLLFGGAERDRRLIVQLGTPKPAGRGTIEIPVTLGVPVESLAWTPKDGGYVAETPVAMAALDEKGGRADLPESHLKVSLKTSPPARTYARFQTTIRVRDDVRQRLVFSVRDAVDGTAIWGEAESKPQPAG
ncbi:MAG: VWA domain-containing protein [Thermoanaerobaculia bacterium]